MKEITEDYCDFETAKLLKEKGFDGESHKHYWGYEPGKEFLTEGSFNPEYDYPAPTIQMAMKWLREKHNLFIQITVDFSDGAYPMYNVYVVNLEICISIIVNRYNRYSYKEAVEAAIKYCLENLI